MIKWLNKVHLAPSVLWKLSVTSHGERLNLSENELQVKSVLLTEVVQTSMKKIILFTFLQYYTK